MKFKKNVVLVLVFLLLNNFLIFSLFCSHNNFLIFNKNNFELEQDFEKKLQSAFSEKHIHLLTTTAIKFKIKKADTIVKYLKLFLDTRKQNNINEKSWKKKQFTEFINQNEHKNRLLNKYRPDNIIIEEKEDCLFLIKQIAKNSGDIDIPE